MTADKPFEIGSVPLTLDVLEEVARRFRPVALASDASFRVALSREVVEFLRDRGEKVYGLTTGFASLREALIPPADTAKLQANLIRSHACAVGEPYPEDIVRAALLIRCCALARGNSGVRVELLQAMIAMLNAHVYPFVPMLGSCGSSGDLAPLSHLVLALMGDPTARLHQARAEFKHPQPVTSSRASDFVPLSKLGPAALGFEPVTLDCKEGLACNNGAVFCIAITALALFDARRAVDTADTIAAISFEAVQAVPDPLTPELVALRPHPGHLESAGRMFWRLFGSSLVPQDAPAGINFARLNAALRLLKSIPDCPEVEKLRQLLNYIADNWDSLRARMLQIQQFTDKAPRLRELGIAHEVFRPALSLWKEIAGLGNGASPCSNEVRRLMCDGWYAVGSKLLRSANSPDVQDNYAFRATPTVHGAVREAISRVSGVVKTELAAVTDNPLILLDELLGRVCGGKAPRKIEEFRRMLEQKPDAVLDCVRSGANFHGEPIGIVADHLAAAVVSVAGISERRSANLLDAAQSKGLPSFLVWQPGLNSGFMIAQYTAASMVSEMKTLAFPSTVDSIPTAENSEDYNAMSATAARKAMRNAELLGRVLAVELLCAYQGLQFRKPGKSASATTVLEKKVAEALGGLFLSLQGLDEESFRKALGELGVSAGCVRDASPCLIADATLYPLLEGAFELLRSGAIAD